MLWYVGVGIEHEHFPCGSFGQTPIVGRGWLSMFNRTRIIFVSALLALCAGCCVRSPAEFGQLTRIGHGKTDKADNHKFTVIYEHLFAPLRRSPIRLCEIGIAGGGSLRMWSEYFSKGIVF